MYNTYENQTNSMLEFSDLEKLLPSKKIKNVTRSQLNILKYFIENPNTILYSIKDKQNLKKRETENTYKSLERVLEKELLKKSNNSNKNEAYKLSDIGIFYLILEGKTFGTGTQQKLLVNYSDFIIFKLFVYPYFSCNFVENLDPNIYSNIFVYLKKCCEKVRKMLLYLDRTYPSFNGYMTDQLFLWNKTTTENVNYNTLRFFLKYFLHLDWADKAEIEKESVNSNIILIKDKSNKGIIKLLEDRSKAVLTIKGKKLYEFIVRELIDDYSIEAYRHDFQSGNTPVSIKESHLINLIIFTQQDLQILIFTILLSYPATVEYFIFDANRKYPIYEVLCFVAQLI